MHIGIDTVALKGEGFTPRVKVGDTVQAGAPLIEFDLDFLATHAKSLLTQIVITNSERVTGWERASGRVAAGKDTLFTVTLADGAAPPARATAATVTSDAIVIPNPTGLHARPAAVLANLAKSFRVDDQAPAWRPPANARSVTAIMALEVGHGAKVRVRGERPGREGGRGESSRRCSRRAAATKAACPRLRRRPRPSRRRQPPPRREVDRSEPAARRRGLAGLAVGRSSRCGARRSRSTKRARRGAERRQLADGHRHRAGPARRAARAASRQGRAGQGRDLRRARGTARRSRSSRDRRVRDRQGQERRLRLEEGGHDSRRSARRAAQPTARAARQRRARRRPARARAPHRRRRTSRPSIRRTPILIAEDLTPSDTAALDRTRVVGFCTTRGGATSHVAILARSLGIPALAGIEPARARRRRTARSVILDGSKGTLRLNPPPEEVARIRQRAGARGAAAQGGPRARARAGGHARRHAHRSLRQHRRTQGRRRRSPSSAAKASACCAPSSSSWNAPTRRPRTSSSRATRPSLQAVGPRASAHHPHARRRRRQAARLPADSEGGQSVPRRARHPRRARSPGDPAHAAARDPARRRRSARSASCSR